MSGFALASCDLNPNTPACSLTIAPTNISVTVNGRQPIVGTAFDCKGNSIRDKKISFSSGNPAIATVSTDGSVIGIAVGQTTVSANANGKSATAQVTVTPELVTSVAVNPPAATLRIGNVRAFTAQLRIGSGQLITKPVRWSSSNTSVATVDQNGSVSAAGVGQAQIVAEADQVIGTSTVTVTLRPVGSCVITPAAQRVAVGQQAQLNVAVRDTAGGTLTNRTISYTSDNEIVAVISASGVISARKAGTAHISASTADAPSVNCTSSTGTTATVEVFDIPVDRVFISPRTGTLRIGLPRLIGAQAVDSLNRVLPERGFTWTSLTPGTATVSQLGLVTGTALGTARIEARSEGKADTATFQITQIPVGSVTVTPLQTTVFEGGATPFVAVVRDSTGAVVTDRVVEWLTSNPSIATVLKTGALTAAATGVSPGTAGISATSEEKGATVQLFVQALPVDTIIAPASFTLVRGATSGFTITLRTANGTEVRNRIVSAVSTDPSIAQVQSSITSSTVTVQAFAVGETTIKLRAINATTGQAEGKETLVRVIVTAP